MFDWLFFCFVILSWVYTGCYLIKYVIFLYFFWGLNENVHRGANECMRGFADGCMRVFFLIKCGQFELSTKLIKRKSFCYTLHWSSTIVVLRNLPPFTLTFSSVNKRCLWVTVLSIRFGVRGYLGKAPVGEWYAKQFPSIWPIGSTANKPAKNEVFGVINFGKQSLNISLPCNNCLCDRWRQWIPQVLFIGKTTGLSNYSRLQKCALLLMHSKKSHNQVLANR